MQDASLHIAFVFQERAPYCVFSSIWYGTLRRSLQKILGFRFRGPPPAFSPMDPVLDHVVSVQNCHLYLGMLEQFWSCFDQFSEEQRLVYLVCAEHRYVQFVRSFDLLPRRYTFVPPIGKIKREKRVLVFKIRVPRRTIKEKTRQCSQDATCITKTIDVVMMWHVHMLSPLRYFEDMALRLKTTDFQNITFPL